MKRVTTRKTGALCSKKKKKKICLLEINIKTAIYKGTMTPENDPTPHKP